MFKLAENKRVKVSGPATKERKKSHKGKGISKGKTPKGVAAKVSTKRRKTRAKRKAARSVSAKPLALVAKLNKELPDVVRKKTLGLPTGIPHRNSYGNFHWNSRGIPMEIPLGIPLVIPMQISR